MLRRVADGAQITVTVHGVPVAEIGLVGSPQRQFFTKADLMSALSHRQADPRLSKHFEDLAGETTDVLDDL